MKLGKKEIVTIIVFNILLIVYGLIHINEMYGLTIGVDDFGYIGMAEYFNGIKWDNLFSNISYYSFGYSFLLYFIIKIFSTPISIFRAIIVLNVILVAISYNISIFVFSRLNPEGKTWHTIVECFCVSFYSSVFIYTNFALTESLLYFLFWLLLFLLLRIPDNNILGYILEALVFVYAFFVHQRCIMLFLAVAVFFCIKIRRKEVKISRVLIFITFLFIFLGAGLFLKNFITSNLYNSNEAVEVNNVYVGRNLCICEWIYCKIFLFTCIKFFDCWHGNLYLDKKNNRMFHEQQKKIRGCSSSIYFMQFYFYNVAPGFFPYLSK